MCSEETERLLLGCLEAEVGAQDTCPLKDSQKQQPQILWLEPWTPGAALPLMLTVRPRAGTWLCPSEPRPW